MSRLPSLPALDGDARFRLNGILALLGSVLCWSFTPVMLRVLTEHVDAWTANGVRYPLSALLYWPILVTAFYRGALRWRVVALAVVPALFAFSGQILWALAPYYLPASMIGFLVRSTLIWSLLGAMILFAEERLLLRKPIFGFGLGVAILGFLGLSASRGVTGGEVTALGILIILGCSFFLGLYAVCVRYFLQRVNPLVAFGVVCQMVSMGTLTLMFLFGNPQGLLELDMLAYVLLGVSSMLGIAFGHVLFYTAVQRLGPATSNSVHLSSPFLTAALAGFVLGEALTPTGWLAGAAMVSGAGMVLWARTSLMPSPREVAENVAEEVAVEPERGEPRTANVARTCLLRLFDRDSSQTHGR